MNMVFCWKRNEVLHWAMVGGFLILLILSQGPVLLSTAWANIEMQTLCGMLIAQSDFVPGEYYGVLHGNPRMAQAVQTLRHAVVLGGEDDGLRWALGRAALAVGDSMTAVDALRTLARRVDYNPLVYEDVMVALSRGGNPEEVITLCESVPPLHYTKVLSDTVALAYLRRFEAHGDWEALQRARALRPGDLYVNHALWEQAQKTGDVKAASVYSKTLSCFPLEAVHPTDERLLDYAAEVVPNLVEENLWDRDRTLTIASFLVWQHSEAPGVERILRWLINYDPSESTWAFLLAELYHRRGDLEQAKIGYSAVLEGDPLYAEAAFRLGVVNEMQGDWNQAAYWYTRYHEMAPTDIMGLTGLVRAYQVLDRPEIGRKTQELNNRLDDHESAAEILGLPYDCIKLGSNMLPEGDFDQTARGQFRNWQIADYATGRTVTDPNASFFAGPDALDVLTGGFAARIDGLWMRKPRKGFFGFISWRDWKGGNYVIETQPGQLYLVSGMYRTGGESERTSIYLGNPQVKLLEGWLPPTSGSWHRFTLFGSHDSPSNEWVQVILRTWGPGRVWFDDLAVKRVDTLYPACGAQLDR